MTHVDIIDTCCSLFPSLALFRSLSLPFLFFFIPGVEDGVANMFGQMATTQVGHAHRDREVTAASGAGGHAGKPQTDGPSVFVPAGSSFSRKYRSRANPNGHGNDWHENIPETTAGRAG